MAARRVDGVWLGGVARLGPRGGNLELGELIADLGKGGLGVVLLYVGGEALVRGASSLALRLGVSALTVGLTVVAFGTSAPELVVSLQAALSGANDIAVANVVGSNICNIALILGLAALLRPTAVEARVVKIDGPLLILASGVVLLLLLDGSVSRLEAGFLVAGLTVYTGVTLWLGRREAPAVRDELRSAAPRRVGLPIVSSLLVVAGLGSLVGGGHLFVEAAVDVARELGLSEAVIGLTIVSVGTSLPELATSTIASARGQGDIAVGNVVGSCLFNILGILGVTALVEPLELGAIRSADLWVMLGLSVALVPFLWTRLELARLEAAALLACYAAYVAWLFSG